MSVKNWQPTPTIVVEDVDQIQVRLGCQSPPSTRSHDFSIRNNISSSSPSSLSTCATITPEIDAYVTPLSLCQPSTPVPTSIPNSFQLKEKVMVVSGGSMPPYLATSGSESSFTSVDIGSSYPAGRSSVGDHDLSWNSWSDASQQATTGCFDIKSGLMCVTRAITGSLTDSKDKNDHHRVDISETSLELHNIKPRLEPALKKRMSTCSMIGIFFICVAIVGLIAIGIAMYVEFVTKPSLLARSKLPILNETTICDYLLDSCDNSTAVISAGLMNQNHTDITVESGKVEAHFSSNFTNQLTSILPK